VLILSLVTDAATQLEGGGERYLQILMYICVYIDTCYVYMYIYTRHVPVLFILLLLILLRRASLVTDAAMRLERGGERAAAGDARYRLGNMYINIRVS